MLFLHQRRRRLNSFLKYPVTYMSNTMHQDDSRRDTAPDPSEVRTYDMIHGIAMGLAFTVLYPLGAVLVRVVSNKYTLWIHASCQMVGFGLMIAGFATGSRVANIMDTVSLAILITLKFHTIQREIPDILSSNLTMRTPYSERSPLPASCCNRGPDCGTTEGIASWAKRRVGHAVTSGSDVFWCSWASSMVALV